MRRIRYQVACSLDGYIADSHGATDWIVDEPSIDFGALFDQFDTLLMGRKTYEGMAAKETDGFWGKKVLVFSRTLRQEDHTDVAIVSDGVEQLLKDLRSAPGKDIWLFGGGELLHTLLEIGCVDTVEPAIVPVLLGTGRPLVSGPAMQATLTLTGHRTYPSGIVWLEYRVNGPRSAR